MLVLLFQTCVSRICICVSSRSGIELRCMQRYNRVAFKMASYSTPHYVAAICMIISVSDAGLSLLVAREAPGWLRHLFCDVRSHSVGNVDPKQWSWVLLLGLRTARLRNGFRLK